VALMLDNIARHRRRRAALEARLIALREREGERVSLSEALTDAAYAEMIDALALARDQIEVPTGVETSEERLEMADRLRRTVDGTLRPLSHRLYAAGRVQPKARESWHAIRSAFRVQQVFPVATAAIITIIMIPIAANPIGGIALGAVALALLAGVRVATSRVDGLKRYEFVMAMVVLGGGSALAALLVTGIVGGDFTVTAMAAGGIFPVSVMVVTSATIMAKRGEDERTASLEQEVTAREVDGLVADRELARASRDLAQYVHGTLQSHLLATAFSIERAVAADDDAAFAQAVEDARAALHSTPQVRPDAGSEGLDAEVREAAALWDGFMGIDVRIDASLDDVPRGVVVDVGRVVAEALGNSWKHGRARSVEVDIAPASGDHLLVRVSDDGRPPAGGPPGMGSAWLDFVAPGGWSLAAAPQGGSVLEVMLPTAPVAAMGLQR
jgi:signal transduction histidine kinase